MAILISKKEEKILQDMLNLAPMPEITLTYHELLGYIYGIAITPDLIEPSEWVPVIFGDETPEYESEEQARQMMSTLLSTLNKHIGAFHEGSLFMPFDLVNIADDDIDNIWEWTSGFDEALSLRPECWEENLDDFSEEEQDHLMNSLVVVEGIVFPEDALDMFDHIPKADLLDMGIDLSLSEAEKALQIQFFMLQALELAIETIQKHGMKLEKKRHAKMRSSSAPFPVRSSKVGKDVECPCGSGKKFQQCCGKKPVQTNLYSIDAGKKKKGKLIKVDFPQHAKKTSKKTIKKSSGSIYQLEVSLAYIEPPVKRILQISSEMSLAELHAVIQYCMGWQDMHMHQFQIGEKFYGPQMADDYDDLDVLDESRFSLQSFEKELLQGILYTYDFGDNWEHVVMLKKVLPVSEGKPYPVLVEGERACPPEDIGGPPMYLELLEYLSNPEDEELRDLFGMAGFEDYDPDYVGKDLINKLLKKVYGTQK